MRGILVDSNIILDVFLDDPNWAEWSESKLEKFSSITKLFINPVVYSEVSTGMAPSPRTQLTILLAPACMFPATAGVLLPAAVQPSRDRIELISFFYCTMKRSAGVEKKWKYASNDE